MGEYADLQQHQHSKQAARRLHSSEGPICHRQHITTVHAVHPFACGLSRRWGPVNRNKSATQAASIGSFAMSDFRSNETGRSGGGRAHPCPLVVHLALQQHGTSPLGAGGRGGDGQRVVVVRVEPRDAEPHVAAVLVLHIVLHGSGVRVCVPAVPAAMVRASLVDTPTSTLHRCSVWWALPRGTVRGWVRRLHRHMLSQPGPGHGCTQENACWQATLHASATRAFAILAMERFKASTKWHCGCLCDSGI